MMPLPCAPAMGARRAPGETGRSPDPVAGCRPAPGGGIPHYRSEDIHGGYARRRCFT
nr:MAG TPA: hypothetical protein [Caudoviricetes sp.]